MPLSAGGSNDDDNLQVLCLKCHQDKTESEVENGIYKRLSDTGSSFSTLKYQQLYMINYPNHMHLLKH